MSNEEQDRYILRKSAEFDDYDPRDYDENGKLKWKRPERLQKANVGVHPHRCDIRVEDFLASFATRGAPRWHMWKLFTTCMQSEPGHEPTEPIQYLTYNTYEFYMEMWEKKRIRDKFFQATKFKNLNEELDSKSTIPPHIDQDKWENNK